MAEPRRGLRGVENMEEMAAWRNSIAECGTIKGWAKAGLVTNSILFCLPCNFVVFFREEKQNMISLAARPGQRHGMRIPKVFARERCRWWRIAISEQPRDTCEKGSSWWSSWKKSRFWSKAHNFLFTFSQRCPCFFRVAPKPEHFHWLIYMIKFINCTVKRNLVTWWTVIRIFLIFMYILSIFGLFWSN